MTRDEVFRDIEATLGLVPTFMKTVPPDVLSLEWPLFKHLELEEGALPQKYRELIGLGIAAATKCRYCTLIHTEAAKLWGATREELEEALLFAQHSAGWSTYLNGEQADLDTLRHELKQVVAFAKSRMAEGGTTKTTTGKRTTELRA